MTHMRIGIRTQLVCAAAAAAFFAVPACARDLTPEFSSRVWIDNDTEVAAVCLNGKELITFRAHAGTGSAVEEADDLAAKLEDLVSDKNFDADRILPASDGDKAAIRVAGNMPVSFLPLTGKSSSPGNTLEASLKVVNGIRTAMGAPTLPNSFPDLSKSTLASAGHSFSGQASWYGPHFHGKKTSDGHRFDQDGMTAAHRSLPFGTKLLVMNRRTGDSCMVVVNDRGPFVGGRILDLSRGAARRLNMIGSGVAMVDCMVLGPQN